MEDKTLEELSLNHLKSELIDVISKQLEIAYHKMSQQVKSGKKKQESLHSQLQTTRQQIEFYSQESQKALEGLKDSNWKITKDMCKLLRRLKPPSTTLVDVCEKFMLVLNQPEKSYEGFKKLSKNFGYLKDLMTSVQGLPVSENTISEVLPIWKNQSIIQAKLGKTCRCGSLMAEWLGYIVEFGLKKETVLSSKRKEPDLEKKLKTQGLLVAESARELQGINEKISQVRKMVECRLELDKEEISDQFGIVPEGNNGYYRTGLHRATASDCSALGTTKAKVNSEFPDFVGENLYEDLQIVESRESKIIYEGLETVGCCRLKFFCF